MKAKQVLFSLGIKRFTKSSEQRLRRAMDDPVARRERPKRRPPFHLALYTWLRTAPNAAGIYRRLIEPAEYADAKRTYLDARRFSELVQAEYRDLSERI